eukprot:5336351-Pyramimonas_sp.AAC.1
MSFGTGPVGSGGCPAAPFPPHAPPPVPATPPRPLPMPFEPGPPALEKGEAANTPGGTPFQSDT